MINECVFFVIYAVFATLANIWKYLSLSGWHVPNFTFKRPGAWSACHYARFMAKSIYSLKMSLCAKFYATWTGKGNDHAKIGNLLQLILWSMVSHESNFSISTTHGPRDDRPNENVLRTWHSHLTSSIESDSTTVMVPNFIHGCNDSSWLRCWR